MKIVVNFAVRGAQPFRHLPDCGPAALFLHINLVYNLLILDADYFFEF